MSILSELVKKPESEVSELLQKFEAKSGYQSHDVRLMADCVQAQRRKIVQLGLDPDDTTAEELHQALISRFEQDAARLESALGINDSSSKAEKAKRTLQLVRNLIKDREIWALKNAEARKLVKTFPPHRTMKFLRFRSVDSMLKREDIKITLTVAEVIESTTWQKNFKAKAAKLGPECFEPRPIKFLQLEDLKVNRVAAVSSFAASAALIGGPDLNVLYMAMNLFDELAKLDRSINLADLSKLNPALQWWADSLHLIAWNNGEPVSFNIKDVGDNHATGKSFVGRTHAAGAQQLWSELLARYKQQLPELAVLEDKINVRPALVPRELALEYAEG